MVQAELKGDLELGTDSVRRADENGVFEALEIEPEQSAETADAAENVAVESLLRQVLNAFLGAVARGDVYALSLIHI